MSIASTYYRHGLRKMIGRDPHEGHRAATPLELLFDLTFVAAFGVAGNELAHGIAEGHGGSAAAAFLGAMVALVWAWTNYSWFASAFDNDDWLFRVLTLVQMAGVVILAIGLPAMFASLEEGGRVTNEVMVAGYVVMRVAVIIQWLRAARGNPRYRAVATTYAFVIGVAQLGWVLLIILPLEATGFLIGAIIVSVIDWLSPLIAEKKGLSHGGATPWHPHHIVERNALLTIIALGETVFGTLAAAQTLTQVEGWSVSSIMVIGLGIVLTFGLWWVYFMVPAGPILAVRRDKALVWGYLHVLVYASIAAVGAGLHVVAYAYDDHYHVSTLVAILAIAIPVLGFIVSLYLLQAWLFSVLLTNFVVQIPVMLLPVVSIVLAALDQPLWLCLLALALAPVAVVVSYEAGAWWVLVAKLQATLDAANARPNRLEGEEID